MQLIVRPNGLIQCVYSDELDYRELGEPTIRRASHVEPNENGQWIADLSPVRGPRLGPFEKRSEALDAEKSYLDALLGQCVVSVEET